MDKPTAPHQSALLRLRDIQINIAQIESVLETITLAEFRNSWLLSSAVERGIERISEASRGIPNELKAIHPEIPWKQIAGIGNILRHDYEAVSPKTIWDTVKTDFPMLKAAVADLINQIKQQSDNEST